MNMQDSIQVRNASPLRVNALTLLCSLVYLPVIAWAQDGSPDQNHAAHAAHSDHAQQTADAHRVAAPPHSMPKPPAHDMHDGQDQHGDDDPHAGHRDLAGASAEGDLPADAAPRTAIPQITEADRSAARGPTHSDHGAHGAHGDNAHDLRIHRYLLVDRLEAWDAEHGSGQAWEITGRVGRDIDKLRVRSEGERKHGATESADLEVLYSRAIAPWWDLTAGLRHDFAPGASQDWAALGVIGMAPYKFEVEATAYLGASGRTALRAEAEYTLLLTNRLILQPLIEAEWHGRSDPARGVGAGLGKVETGLRLRYEFRREFAPYVGIVHERSFGRSADFAREEGEDIRDTRMVAGIRFWF